MLIYLSLTLVPLTSWSPYLSLVPWTNCRFPYLSLTLVPLTSCVPT